MGRDGAGSRRARWDGWLVALALIGIIGMLLAPPRGLLDKADYVAYAVCHRIPERTFIFAGRPLPLCARCSGTYLGALAGLIVLILRGRGRAADLPESYKRYLVNGIREAFDMPGVPIRLIVKAGKNPYTDGDRGGSGN